MLKLSFLSYRTELEHFRYTEALQLVTEDDKQLKAVLHRNRALTRLKRDDFEGAEQDATKGISDY